MWLHFFSFFIWVLCGYHFVLSSRFMSFVFFCFCLGFKIPSFCLISFSFFPLFSLTLNGQHLHRSDTTNNHINFAAARCFIFQWNYFETCYYTELSFYKIIEYASEHFCQQTAEKIHNRNYDAQKCFRASIQVVKFINFSFQHITAATKSCIEHEWPVVNVCCQNKWLFMVSCTMLTTYIFVLISQHSLVVHRSVFVRWIWYFFSPSNLRRSFFSLFQSKISNTNANEPKIY